ncbi:MucBP domain-containing protein, partial [Streptococcus sciuri]
PDDPTKVNPTPVPSLDGWEPVDPSDVTPDNPTTDTPVKYRHKVSVAEGHLTVHYVDEVGNPLRPSETSEDKQGTPYHTSPKVIEGYELLSVKGSEEGQFTDGEQIVVYVYRKIVAPAPIPDDKPETKQTHSDEIPKKEVTTAPRSQTPKTVAKQAVLPSTGE